MCADVTRDALTAEDARILALETARVAGHTLKVTVLDPGGMAQRSPCGQDRA